MTVIEIEGLRKVYRRMRAPSTVAVDGLDLVVPPGGVFGFLGPNGSGKTTTIRCLLGLVRPNAGRCRLLGADSVAGVSLAGVIRRVGSIVESPTLFPGMSGRRNLRLLARMDGIGERRVTEVLERVGLADRARDRVKTYSLGMRQRLALAAALLRDPEVLILDEPANGLDPAGIVEVRELLRTLGAEGRTVFVSSHILAEIQQICDHVAILSRGRCVASGAVADVLARGRVAGVLVRVPDLQKGLDALVAGGVDARIDGDVIRCVVAPEDAAIVTRKLAAKRIYLTELRPDAVTLETVFLELTGSPQEARG